MVMAQVSIFFAGSSLLVIERIGFLVPVSFLTNRNWHGSSQTQRFPLLSKPEAPELGKKHHPDRGSQCVCAVRSPYSLRFLGVLPSGETELNFFFLNTR